MIEPDWEVDIVLFVVMVTVLHFFEDLFPRRRLRLESKAPLDANEAAQFTSTGRASFPAQYKQAYAEFLWEEQGQI